MLKTVSTQAITGSLSYQGTWNANTNVPVLTSSVGTQNWYYVVSTAGNTTLNGVSNWNVGDWAIFNGSVWEKVDGSSLGTMAYQNASAVAITGGTINTTTINTGTFVNANITSVYTTFPNSYLSNSSTTIGNTVVTLGSTVSALGNVTLNNVTVTSGSVPAGVISGNVAVANIANNIEGGGNNYLVYQSADNTTAFLAPGTSGYPLVSVTSSPPAFTGTLNIPNGTFGNLTSSNVTITGGTINVQATKQTASTNANATMSTASIPLVPQGYMLFDLNGTVVKIPYYAQ